MAERPVQHIVAHSKPMVYKGDGDVDYLYLPSRSLGGIDRVNGALFLLPDHNDVREYATQLDHVRLRLGVKSQGELAPVYIPHTDEILDVAILVHLNILQERLEKGQRYRLSPYSHTAENDAWMEALRQRGYPIHADIALKNESLNHLDNRGGWGRHVWDPRFTPVPQQVDIPYPVSWIGRTQEEVIEAYQRVATETQNPKVQFKGVHSAGGFVNRTVHSTDEVAHWYDQFTRQGALGESGAVEMQAFIQNLGKILSFQYSTTSNGIHVVDTPGLISEQILQDSNWQGNKFNDPGLVARHKTHVQAMFERLIPVLNGSQAKGGFDIGETPSGLVVIEHNAKRITGGHPGIALMEALNVPRNMPAVTKKCPYTINCDLTTLWNVLEQEGIGFDPVSKQGVFPVCWMNKYYGMLMTFGSVDNADSLEQQLDQVYERLAQLGYVSN